MRRFALLAVLLAGCGGSHHVTPPQRTPAPTPKPGPEAAIQRTLNRLARPKAHASGPRTQRALASGAADLGIYGVAMSLVGAKVHAKRADVDVRLTYKVRGVSGDFVGPLKLRAALGPAGWAITGTRQTRALPPWLVGAYRRLRTPHFVIWAPAGVDPAAGGLDTALEAGYARMRGTLPQARLRRRYLVVVAAGAVRARRLTSHIRGLGGLTALTDTQVRQTGPALRVSEVRSQRLLVLWSSFAAIPAEAQRIVVAHELTHAVLAPVTSGRVPSWLTEGIAMYVSGDRRAPVGAVRAGALRRLSRSDAIGRLSGRAQAAAYALASAATFDLAERYGRRRLLRLYQAFNRTSLPGHGAAVVDAALRSVLHLSLRGLERRI